MHRVFQEDPGLFSRACNKLLGIDMPTPAAISIMSPDLTEIRPLERRADTVLRIDMADGCGYLLVIEAQGKKDVDKPGSWATENRGTGSRRAAPRACASAGSRRWRSPNSSSAWRSWRRRGRQRRSRGSRVPARPAL
jgi:hypothetical protein